MERCSISNKPCGDCLLLTANITYRRGSWKINLGYCCDSVAVGGRSKERAGTIPNLKPVRQTGGKAACFIYVLMSQNPYLSLSPNLNATLSTPVDAWSILN